MSDDDRGKQLKAIDRHPRTIFREHLRAMFGGFDGDTADDLALTLDEGDDEEANKALLTELQVLARQAQGLA